MEIVDDPLPPPLPYRIASGKVRARYGELADAGFQALPDVLLLYQSNVGVSSEELNVLLNLMAHWYEPDRMPYPSSISIARRMGVSRRTIQRVLANLVEKGFVEKLKPTAAPQAAAYNVEPLLEKFRPFARHRAAALGRLRPLERDVAQRIERPLSTLE